MDKNENRDARTGQVLTSFPHREGFMRPPPFGLPPWGTAQLARIECGTQNEVSGRVPPRSRHLFLEER